ncbi:TPA: phage minor tail protein L, partial [Klebsiella pneumoniae]|nr:phage minor tail protein L [Klebsiella pneumoniae]HBZ2927716.1 phage minor tail protein L [Klebsiella pneumoniae]
MGIRADIQSLSPSALIELFELDMSVTTSGGKLYFHAGTNGLSQPIVWQGVSYEPWP